MSLTNAPCNAASHKDKPQLACAAKSSTDYAFERANFLPQRNVMMQHYGDYLDSRLQRIEKEEYGPLKRENI